MNNKESIMVTLIVLAVILGIAFLAVQVKKNGMSADGDAPRVNYEVIIDEKTGCEYLSRSYRGGLTPRYDHEGTHICNFNNITVGK